MEDRTFCFWGGILEREGRKEERKKFWRERRKIIYSRKKERLEIDFSI